MKIKKNFEVCLDIKPIEMNGEIKQVILDKLRETYEGKCHENTFIVKILSLVKKSMIRITSDLTGDGTVNVVFSAEANVYNIGDIITGCVIQNVAENHRILCSKNNNLAINIAGSVETKKLLPKQKIPIMVKKIKYETRKDKVSIGGIPYTYAGKFIVYILSEDYGKEPGEDVEIIKSKLAEVASAVEELGKCDGKLITHMSNHFHPFKTSPNELLSMVKSPLSVVDFIKDWHKLAKKNTLWTRHTILEKGNPGCLYADSSSVIGNEVFLKAPYMFVQITETPATVFLALLEDYLKFIVFLQEMAEEYKSEEVYESHNNLWTIYRFIKRDDHITM